MPRIKANIPELDKGSSTLFEYLFYVRITAMETVGSPRLTLSLQQEIRKMRNVIENFIQNNRYAYFDIQVLGDDLNPNKPLHGVTVRNFDVFIPDVDPNRYVICIEPSWNDCQVYQLSPTGIRQREIII